MSHFPEQIVELAGMGNGGAMPGPIG